MRECCEAGKHGGWLALFVPLLLVSGCGRVGCCQSDRTRSNMIAIRHALDEYAINNSGTYPCALDVLVIPDVDGHSYLEGYNGKVPTDSWDRAFHYEAPTPSYPGPHVWSYGADGRRGGSGDDADVDSDDFHSEG